MDLDAAGATTRPAEVIVPLDCKGLDVESADERERNGPGEPEPWPVAVDGVELLDSLMAAFGDHLKLPPFGAEACSLWTLHTYCFEAFAFTPRLHIKSPTKRCGKTELLTMLAKLVSRQVSTSDITGAVLFRLIEYKHPTILIDEWDSMSAGVKAEPLRNVLNSGFLSTGCTYRLESIEGVMVPMRFSTFAPVAVASIGALPATAADRSIILPMRRKMRNEYVARSRNFDGREIKRKCVRWVTDTFKTLCQAKPEFPASLNDRQQDCWEPLFALADAVGPGWSTLARKAAIGLSLVDDDTETSEEAMLQDIKKIFEREGGDRIFTKDLRRGLIEMKDAPWRTISNGASLTPHKLSSTLGAFGIGSGTIRQGKRTDKGYHREQFEDSWKRYAPSNTEADQMATGIRSIGATQPEKQQAGPRSQT